MPTWSYFAAMTAVCRAMHTFAHTDTHTHRYTHAYSYSLSHSGTQSGIHSMLVYSPTAARSSIVIHFNLPSGFPFVSFSLVCSRLCPLPLLLPLPLFLPPSSSRSCCQLTAMTISVPDSLRGSDLPKNLKKNWLCSKEFRIGGNTSFSATFCAIPAPFWLISGLFNKPGPRSVVWRDLCNHCRTLLLLLIDSGYPVQGTGYRRLLYFANSQWALLLCHVRAIYLCCTTWGLIDLILCLNTAACAAGEDASDRERERVTHVWH